MKVEGGEGVVCVGCGCRGQPEGMRSQVGRSSFTTGSSRCMGRAWGILVKSYQMFPDESDADNKYRWWRKFSVALTRRLHQARMNVPPLVRDWATRTHQQVGKVTDLSNNTVVVSGSGFHRSKFVRARGPVKD